MNYHDFDIWIDELREDHYPIRAEWPEAHAQASGKLRLDADSLARNLKRFDEEVTDREFAKSFGKELYEAIFQEQIATLYQLSLGEVLRNPNEGLRIRLRIRPPKLAAMPWEILYDGRHFLATSRKTLLTRYIDLLAPINELETPLPIGVLIVIPEGSGLDTEGEKGGVVKALKELGEVVYFKVLEENVTRSAIRKELRNGKYHVFHFIGHGKYDEAHQGYLVLTSETNPDGDLIDAESFRLFFTDYKHIKLVLLNSCEGAQVSDTKPFAGMAPQLIDETIPAVIAMQYPIRDKVAKLFAHEFYESLCSGDDQGRIDACTSYARLSVCQEFDRTNDFAIPVIFMRSKTGTIFGFEAEKKKIVSVRELHIAKQLLGAQESNIEAIVEQQKQAPAEEAEKLEEQLAKQTQAAQVNRDKIAKWRKRVLIQSTVFLVILAACWTGILGLLNVDEYLERRFVSFMDPYIDKPFTDKLRLIAINEGNDNGPFGSFDADDSASTIKWRKTYAKLTSDLAAAKAKVVVLDLFFDEEPEVDQDLAKAFQEAERLGTKVVVAVSATNAGVVQPLPDLLKSALNGSWGDGNNLLRHRRSELVREAILGKLSAVSSDRSTSKCGKGESPILPSLPLMAVMQFGNSNDSVPVCPGETRNWVQPVEACVDEDQDEINLRDAASQVVKRIPANYNFINNLGMVSKVDIAEPSQLEGISETIKSAYSDSQVLRKPNTYRGAIVVIGVRRLGECPGPVNPDVVCVSDSEGEPRKGKRYGMEVQANIISNLMTCTYIRPTAIGWDLFLILLMVGLGVLLQLKERKWLPFRIPVKIPFTEKKIVIPWLLIAVPIAYFLIAFVVYKEWRILPGNAAYQFLALVTSYFTSKMTRRRLGSS